MRLLSTDAMLSTPISASLLSHATVCAGSTLSEASKQEFRSVLASLGISNPVTRYPRRACPRARTLRPERALSTKDSQRNCTMPLRVEGGLQNDSRADGKANTRTPASVKNRGKLWRCARGLFVHLSFLARLTSWAVRKLWVRAVRFFRPL